MNDTLYHENGPARGVVARATTTASDTMVAIGGEAAILSRIRSTGCALALWRRRLDPALAAALAALPHEGIDDVDAAVPTDGAAVHVAAGLGAAAYPVAVAVPLACDIAMLAGLHAGLWGWSSVRMRLDWIETNACRRFHADMVGTRLVTTYAGRGTQWRRADETREAAAGEVLVMKGRLLAPEAPVLHRSPPIAVEGGRRLLLVIDAPRRATE